MVLTSATRLTLLPGALALFLGSCAPPAYAGGPRHAILISIDTLRPDHMGCYGHPRPTSPALDALAARGVRFEDVTAAAPWTLPSHASMLTGLFASHHGVKHHETSLSEDVVTLAEEFRDDGFQTFAVVTSHNVGAPQFRLDQGFSEFHHIVEEIPPGSGTQISNNGRKVVKRAKDLLGERDGDRPFFLFLHFYDVHPDFTPGPEYRAEFVGPYSGRLTGSTDELMGVRNGLLKIGDDDVRWLREMYDAEIRELDDLLGDFFQWLEGEDLLAESLLVVTSDHGEEFLEHGSVLHGRTLHQEVLRVPLLVGGPGIPPSVVVRTPVHGIDVTPTILGVMDIPSRMPRDGLDLSAAWRGETLPERTLFAGASHNNMVEGRRVHDIKAMARRGNSKLLLDTHTGAVELYDLARDPMEQDDLAVAQPDRASELRDELERFRAGAVPLESIPGPTEAERRMLDALGY